MELRLLALVVSLLAGCCIADFVSQNTPIIVSAITKVARANHNVDETPKSESNGTSASLISTTSEVPIITEKQQTQNDNLSITSQENIWTALESFLVPPSGIESSVTSAPLSFIKLLQSLDDIATTSKAVTEHQSGRFARSLDDDEELEEDEEEDSTPLTPSLEDALSRLANARDDRLVSFESDTLPTSPTPPQTVPAWARVPLYYQGAGLQLRREPSPPALINPALTSVPSNALDLSALLAMMLRSYPSSPSPLIPNLLFPSMSLVNRSSAIPPVPQSYGNSVNSLFGKSYNPPKLLPDLKSDDKDGSSKELDPAESTQDKVSAKKPEDNDYEYEYVYYYYDEDDPNNKTMVVKPASAVKPKIDQKVGSTAVPALLPRQPVGPSAAEGRSVDGGIAGSPDNLLRDLDMRPPLLTPFFTTPPPVKSQPLPFVQGPQSPVMFLGIQREIHQGPRVPARTHPAKEPDDLYAFSRVFEDQTSQSILPFTYKPQLEDIGEGRVFEPNATDDELLVPKPKPTTTKLPKKTTTTEKPTTTSGKGRRPGGRRTTTQPTEATTSQKGRRLPGRRNNQRKNTRRGKEPTEKPDEADDDVTTEKPARGGRRGTRPSRTRTTGKPKAGGRRKTTPSSKSNGKNEKTTTPASSDDATTQPAAIATTKRLSNLFPRRKTLKPTSPSPTPSEEEGGNEEEEVQITEKQTASQQSGRKTRTTTTPLTTTNEQSEEGVEAEAEEEPPTPATPAPKSPIQRLRPLRPLRITTTQDPENS